MFLLRRAAFRAVAAKPSTTLRYQQRSIITAARPALISRQQWFASSLQKRFASDEAKPTESEEVVAAEATKRVPEFETSTETTAEVTGQDSQISVDQLSRSESHINANILYVGNLFFEVSEDALERLMSQYGIVKKTKIIFDHRGLSKGFGYVEFTNAEDAAKAIDALNQQPFQGRRLSVQIHQRKEALNRVGNNRSGDEKPSVPSKTLFIGNMSFDMSDKDLNDLFRDIKNVVDVRVAIDRRTGQPRGFAHCDFLDIESATKAREVLADKEVHGRSLRVDFSRSASDRAPRDGYQRGDGPPRDGPRRDGPARERY